MDERGHVKIPVMDRTLADIVERERGAGWRESAFCRACKISGPSGLDDAAFVALSHNRYCPVRLAAERHEYLTLWRLAEANLKQVVAEDEQQSSQEPTP